MKEIKQINPNKIRDDAQDKVQAQVEIMAEHFASLRQETQIARQGIVNTLTSFALDYYDRQITSAKYLVDSLIKSINFRESVTGFMRVTMEEYGGEKATEDDWEKEGKFSDFLNSLVSSSDSNFYAIVGIYGATKGKILYAIDEQYFGEDISESTIFTRAVSENRTTKSIENIQGNIVSASAGFLKNMQGVNQAILVCGYKTDAFSMRFLARDIQAKVALFVKDEEGFGECRYWTITNQDNELIEAFRMPDSICDRFLGCWKTIEENAGNSAIDGRSIRKDFRVVRDEILGGVEYVLAYQGLIAEDGKLLGVLAIGYDIHHAINRELGIAKEMDLAIDAAREANLNAGQKAEELEIAIQKADAANKAKSEFLANMSHELRTPLNAIIGFSDILEGNISDPKQKGYLDRICTSGGTLLTLINEILDLSKIESGKMELKYSVVSPFEIFNETKLLFEQDTYEKGIELIANISESIPEALLLDGKRIRQILINLIGNAVKFTENGSITLTVNCEYLDCRAKSVIKLNISVADTGVGIPEDQQLIIFDAFGQVKDQRSEKDGGTGLGLAISRRIAEAMGGSLTLESVVGRGSTFIVEIKEVEVAAVSEFESDKYKTFDYKAISFLPARVLIVDDIDYNRELLISFLERYKFELIEATNGKEAIEEIRKYKPDLILLDIKMPVMDGYGVSAILKDDEHLKDIPIVAVTAFALKGDEERISKLCDGYLSKPVRRGALIIEVMKYLPHTAKEVEKTVEPEKTDSYTEEEIKQKVAMLPPELHEEFLRSAQLGDMNAISELITRVSITDAGLAGELRNYTDNCEFEELLRVLT